MVALCYPDSDGSSVDSKPGHRTSNLNPGASVAVMQASIAMATSAALKSKKRKKLSNGM